MKVFNVDGHVVVASDSNEAVCKDVANRLVVMVGLVNSRAQTERFYNDLLLNARNGSVTVRGVVYHAEEILN